MFDLHTTHHTTPVPSADAGGPPDHVGGPPPFTPSPYQSAIFSFISAVDCGNAIVEAVAGSGKTTTLIHAAKLHPGAASSIFLAFNKSIAEELRGRGVNASTFHALSLNALRPRLPGGFKIEGGKLHAIFRTIVHKDLQDDYADLPRLVSLGKNAALGLDGPVAADDFTSILGNHDLTFPDEAKACEFAARIFNLSADDTSTIDFDDMLWMAVARKAVFPYFDFIYVDEAQDTNPLQHYILRAISHHRSRYIFVGDSRQAIYGFRGAGTDSMSYLSKAFHCTALPLSISYRCPQAVVHLAQKYAPQIEASPSAPTGTVSTPAEWTISAVPSGAAILCRTTKPLIRMAYTFLRAGRRVQVLGRDICAGFKTTIKAAKGAHNLDSLISLLERKRDIESSRERGKNRIAKATAIEDRYDSLIYILQSLDPHTPLKDIPREIDALFADSPGAVQFSTVHKAKGLEWDDVFILDSHRLMPLKYATEGWQLQQEYNIIYVAITRAKRSLTFIGSDNLRSDE